MSKLKILITGAAGVTGSILVKECIKQNIPIRILVRNPEKVKHLKGNKMVEIFEGDMLKPETYQNALTGIERALLMSTAFDRLIETQQTFIDTAKKVGVRYIIKFSGAESGIGFNSQNFIGTKNHENLEDYLVHSGVAWTIIRPSQFMQMYLPSLPTGVNLEKEALILPYGKAKLSPTDIEDVVKVCVKLLIQNGHENRIYEMTGPDAMDMYEASEIISRVIQRKIFYFPPTLDEYVKSMEGKVPAERQTILTQIAMERSKCIDSHIKLDTHKLFGVRPTNFAEFIFKNLSAFKK